MDKPKSVDKRPERTEKPTSIRLGSLKPILQQRSMEIDRSMNWLILKIIKDYLDALYNPTKSNRL